MNELENLLEFEIREDNDINYVISKMCNLLEFFRSSEKYIGFAPFLDVYLRVTQTVLGKYKSNNNYFNDYKKIESIDLYFAKLYFDPIKKYILEGIKNEPWRTYIEYCEKDNGTPIVQVLLGINSHINSDLLTTIKNLNYEEEEDFERINEILLELIPQVMKNLAIEYKDIYGVAGYLAHPITKYEFEKTIVKWRSDVWSNCKFIHENKNMYNIENIYHLETENIAKNIITSFDEISSIKSAFKGLKNLNSLELKLTLDKLVCQ